MPPSEYPDAVQQQASPRHEDIEDDDFVVVSGGGESERRDVSWPSFCHAYARATQASVARNTESLVHRVSRQWQLWSEDGKASLYDIHWHRTYSMIEYHSEIPRWMMTTFESVGSMTPATTAFSDSLSSISPAVRRLGWRFA